MRKLKLFAVIFFISYSISWAQGKIYFKSEADNIYGQIKQSVQLSSSYLSTLASTTTSHIMFKIINGKLIILGDQRKVLYPSGISINSTEVMSAFSVSIVKDLISQGNNDLTTIEIREGNILTVSNGNYTLESSIPCPPYCPD